MRSILALLSLAVLFTACEPTLESKLKSQMVDAPADQAGKDKNQLLQYAIDNQLDVQSTPSGILYVMENMGEGDAHPDENSYITAHYHGTLTDGTVFDSSVDRGETFQFSLGGVIPGWQEAIKMLKKGGKGKFLIPSGMAYGPRGAGGAIPPNTPLVFDIELIEFADQAEMAAKQNAIDQEAIAQFIGEKGLETKQTESGIHYILEKEGTGDAHPEASSKVTVHYHGTLLDGTVFDSSVDRGETISFGLNQVIPGWQEAIPLLKKGGKGKFIIPSTLAYGNRQAGKIPPNSVLVFDVELFDF